MKKFVKVEIYNVTVVFLIVATKLEFEMFYHDNVERISDDEYKRMFKDTFYNDKCGGYTTSLDCGDFVCCIKDASKKDFVAHEILHTANRILLSRGVTPDFDNDEPQAYLVGYLTRVFYETIDNNK